MASNPCHQLSLFNSSRSGELVVTCSRGLIYISMVNKKLFRCLLVIRMSGFVVCHGRGEEVLRSPFKEGLVTQLQRVWCRQVAGSSLGSASTAQNHLAKVISS
jgi:hypothetical protein